jgi:hypothetical protein
VGGDAGAAGAGTGRGAGGGRGGAVRRRRYVGNRAPTGVNRDPMAQPTSASRTLDSGPVIRAVGEVYDEDR